jgi:hypothetical protein
MNVTAEIDGKERSAVLVEALRLSGRLRLRVRGESMLPALWPGDLTHIEECRLSEVRRNDIVLALRDGRLFLHRFCHHAADGGFVLRGDAMPGPDPVYPAGAFLGTLVPGMRRQALSPRWARVLGMIFCNWGLARRLALRWHGRRDGRAEQIDRLAPAS